MEATAKKPRAKKITADESADRLQDVKITMEFREGQDLYDRYSRFVIKGGTPEERAPLVQEKRRMYARAIKSLNDTLKKASGNLRREIVSFLRDRGIASVADEQWLAEIESNECVELCECKNEPVYGHFIKVNEKYKFKKYFSPEKRTTVYHVYARRVIGSREQDSENVYFKLVNHMPILEADLSKERVVYYRREFNAVQFDRHFNEC